MKRFIEAPHIPKGRVCGVVIGEKYKKVLKNGLFERNVDVIWLKNNCFVDERLNGHADLSLVHIGNNRFFAQRDMFVNLLTNIELIETDVPESTEYPNDAALNVCIFGNRAILNPKTANKQLIKLYSGRIIKCNQGYTKCSACAVNENAVITDDKGIAEACAENGIDTLTVSKGFVELEGFEYGFIGGAAFKLSACELAFTGQIENEKEKQRIESFLNKHGVRAVYLTERKIFDIGSAIPIIEEI